MAGNRSVANNPQISRDSAEIAYAKVRTAEWLGRLCLLKDSLTSTFFESMQWATGDLEPVLQTLKKQTASSKLKSVRAAHTAIKEVLKEPVYRLADECEELVQKHHCLVPAMINEIQHICGSLVENAGNAVPENFLAARRGLEEVFGLDRENVLLCEFAYLFENISQLHDLFDICRYPSKFERLYICAHILDMPQKQFTRRINELKDCGLFAGCVDEICLPDSVQSFWSAADLDPFALFCHPLEGETLPLANFHLPAEDVQHVRRLLQKKGDAPVHILLYGPSGTGKTTFARSLARACKVNAWSVVSREEDDEDDRRASLIASLHMASRHEGSFVLVDEAERLLDTDFSAKHRTKDKAWLNEFLERPGQRVVWISNQVEHIDPAVRRRFTYSIHFNSLKEKERLAVWKQVLKRQKLSRYFQEERVKELVRDYPVEAAVIQKAAVQAHNLYPARKDFYPALKRILNAHLVLEGDGNKNPVKKPAEIRDFTLAGVCMKGNVSELVERCSRVDAALRSGKVLRPGCGTMLFYGPPGTGKTALARFIARKVDRECKVMRASDLLSPYIGVSEMQVAEAFREIEDSGVVLAIDEVDTFLYSRKESQHTWENSLVNEFLTALEMCRGFCICTTNRREYLDEAAMRRFSHKVEFCYADRSQVQALYDNLLAPLCTDSLSSELQCRLCAMTRLTPGSFHAVRAQFDPLFHDPAKLTHEIMLNALEREAMLNLEPRTREVGFL